jgi:hypothetical protein
MTRAVRVVLRDCGLGLALGAFAGLSLALWVFLRNGMTGGRLEEQHGINATLLGFTYIIGGSIAGLGGGLLRPHLAKVWGQALLCFACAFGLYGAVSVAMEQRLFGGPIIDGLVMATFATPVWLVYLRWSRGLQRDLHRAAGKVFVEPPPRVPLPVETFVLYRSTPQGGQFRLGAYSTRASAEAEMARLSGLPHRYWIEQE